MKFVLMLVLIDNKIDINIYNRIILNMKFFKFLICGSNLKSMERNLDISPNEVKEPSIEKMIPKKKHRHLQRETTTLQESNYNLKVSEYDQYTDFKYICSGYFAKVYTAKDKDKELVAIKKINCKTNRFNKVAKREIKMLLSINSENIIKIKDILTSNNNIYIVLPYYKKDLFTYIPKILGKPHKIFKILLGIAKGLLDLHEMHIMHGDIKPENIMLSNTDQPILIDLGLAKYTNIVTLDKESRSLSGTLLYLPPEVIEHLHYTDKMDIWALGVIMYMMMFFREPFESKNINDKEEVMHNIRYKEQYYPISWQINNKVVYKDDMIYKKMVDLNKHLLRKKPQDRLNIYQVVDKLDEILIDIYKNQSYASLELSHNLMVQHLISFHTM